MTKPTLKQVFRMLAKGQHRAPDRSYFCGASEDAALIEIGDYLVIIDFDFDGLPKAEMWLCGEDESWSWTPTARSFEWVNA